MRSQQRAVNHNGAHASHTYTYKDVAHALARARARNKETKVERAIAAAQCSARARMTTTTARTHRSRHCLPLRPGMRVEMADCECAAPRVFFFVVVVFWRVDSGASEYIFRKVGSFDSRIILRFYSPNSNCHIVRPVCAPCRLLRRSCQIPSHETNSANNTFMKFLEFLLVFL